MIEREKYFIDKNFQSKFIIKFSSIVIVSSLVFALSIIYFSWDASMVTIVDTQVSVKRSSDFILPMVSIVFLIVLLFSSLAVLVLTLRASHKIAGPLSRFVKEIDLMAEGDLKRNFSIRGNDQLKTLSNSLKNMGSQMRKKQAQIQKDFAYLQSFMAEKNFSPNSKDADECLKRIKKVQASLNEFKV